MTPPNPDRLRQIDALFEQALALPEAERAVFLAGLDPATRTMLNRLLAADEPSGLDEAIAGLASIPAAPYESWIGQRIGPYRVTHEIGHGGMGVVLGAVRDDAEFSQEVALKVAARARYAPEFAARFRDERQILAQLRHPHIARLLDGGTTGDGLPYFAMELVDGVPINEYSRRRGFGLRARVELFLLVCDAVEYAHQNLVVHRDIKPGNILVDESGQPHLLDFGIAKLLDPMQPDQAGTHLLPLTPDYCSPEQVRGEPVTTRTDVYLLGLLLFELLCGRRGQIADTTSPAALQRTICETEIPLASRSAPPELARQLRGDLERIIAKATRKPPADRYASVEALAADLHAWLEHRPISVRSSERTYRWGRWLERHWAAVAAGALIFATTLGGGASAWRQAQRAERRFEQVRGIARALMFDVENSIAELPGSVPAQKVVVETALRYLDSLAKESSLDPRLLTELGAGYRRIARIQGGFQTPSLGHTDEAEVSLLRAKALLARASASGGGPEALVELAETELALAESARKSGRAPESTRRLADALAAAKQSGVGRTLAHVYTELCGDTSQGLPDPENGRRAVEILETLRQNARQDAEIRADLATAYSAYGSTLLNARQTREALTQYEKYAELEREAVAAKPDSMANRRNLMLAYSKVGDAWWGFPGISLGDREKALASYRLMLEQAEWMTKADPKSRSVRTDHAMSLMRLGGALPPRDPESIARLRESFTRLEELAKEEPKNQTLRRSQMDACLRLAEIFQARKEDANAKEELQRAAGIGERAVAADPRQLNMRTWLIRAYSSLGRLLARGKNRAAAEAVIEKCRLHMEEAARLDKSATSIAWAPRFHTWQGDVFALLGDAERARAERTASAKLWRSATGGVKLPPALEAEMAKAVAAAQ